MESKSKPMTDGESIYAAISPFLFSQHTLTRKEAEKMISEMIDKRINYWKSIVEDVAKVGIISDKSYHRANVVISRAGKAIQKSSS